MQAELQAEKFFNSDRLRSITTSAGTQPAWLNPEFKYSVLSPGTQVDPNKPILDISNTPVLTETQYLAVLTEVDRGERTGFLAERIRIPSFCIDPMYTSLTDDTIPADTLSGYYGGCFPYYKQTNDPTLDPSAQGVDGAATTRQPRMFRVGVTVRSTNATKPFLC